MGRKKSLGKSIFYHDPIDKKYCMYFAKLRGITYSQAIRMMMREENLKLARIYKANIKIGGHIAGIKKVRRSVRGYKTRDEENEFD